MHIGHFEIDRPLILAPMDDVGDSVFRMICKEHGADVLYTEFANSEALCRNVRKTMGKIAIADAERPIGVQIYGRSEESMEKATAVAEEASPDFIDVNCGCSVKKIATRGDGAGLLRDLKQMERVVRAVVGATRLPVTVKTRLGWDSEHIVILDVVRMLEDIGVQALAVHCRTREQGYSGDADWTWLERIKEVSTLPLIGNGDVRTPDDAARMFSTGCDGVMIGRGAIHNPWLFEYAKHFLATGERLPEPTIQERVALCLEHLKRAAEVKGEQRAVREHRKHYVGYFKAAYCVAKLRRDLMTYTEIAPIEARLSRFLEEVAARPSASEA